MAIFGAASSSMFLTTPKDFSRWDKKTPAHLVRGLKSSALSGADPGEKSGRGNGQRR